MKDILTCARKRASSTTRYQKLENRNWIIFRGGSPGVGRFWTLRRPRTTVAGWHTNSLPLTTKMNNSSMKPFYL